MIRFVSISLGALALTVLAAGGQAETPTASASASSAVYGTWRNPKGTIDVRTQSCADALCGKIVRADAKARSDAAKKGVTTLVGLELLQDYHRKGDEWAGSVYVPDMGHTFSSRIKLLGPDQLKISGCLIGGFLCKSQVWRRV